MARRYAASLRATAMVAWLWLLCAASPLVENGQLRVESRSQMRGFQQHRLQVSIALLGDGHAPGTVSRGLLSAAQTAVADHLLDGVEPLDLADFEHPGQRRDVADYRVLSKLETV
jgi:hypothetical protein